jgi:hypothetical protein
MVAAEATTVNEFRKRCCHVPNKKGVTEAARERFPT